MQNQGGGGGELRFEGKLGSLGGKLLQHSRRDGVAQENFLESRVLPSMSLELVIHYID